MPRRYYLANCYPRINDETPREYEKRLEIAAEAHSFSPRCAVNLHSECSWHPVDCHCLCHEQTDPDEQLRAKVIELLRPLPDDYTLTRDEDFSEVAQQIINLVRSHK